jgi:ATP-dependent DNA helicase HFM1/MER3
MVRLFQNQVKNGNFDARPQGKRKIIYLAPIKALCQERLDDWQKKFGPLGVKCVELTGDSENINSQTLVSADVILTTPEKWDSITRKWKEIKYLVGQVALLLIDEVHLLHEDRGATLEAVVSR